MNLEAIIQLLSILAGLVQFAFKEIGVTNQNAIELSDKLKQMIDESRDPTIEEWAEMNDKFQALEGDND